MAYKITCGGDVHHDARYFRVYDDHNRHNAGIGMKTADIQNGIIDYRGDLWYNIIYLI